MYCNPPPRTGTCLYGSDEFVATEATNGLTDRLEFVATEGSNSLCTKQGHEQGEGRRTNHFVQSTRRNAPAENVGNVGKRLEVRNNEAVKVRMKHLVAKEVDKKKRGSKKEEQKSNKNEWLHPEL